MSIGTLACRVFIVKKLTFIVLLASSVLLSGCAVKPGKLSCREGASEVRENSTLKSKRQSRNRTRIAENKRISCNDIDRQQHRNSESLAADQCRDSKSRVTDRSRTSKSRAADRSRDNNPRAADRNRDNRPRVVHHSRDSELRTADRNRDNKPRVTHHRRDSEPQVDDRSYDKLRVVDRRYDSPSPSQVTGESHISLRERR